jgi:hypothetical protein
MPGLEANGSSSAGNMWYSLDHSYAHFVSFSAETDYPNAYHTPWPTPQFHSLTRPRLLGMQRMRHVTTRHDTDLTRRSSAIR